MSTDSINHKRPNRSTKRTKCGTPKLRTYPDGTFIGNFGNARNSAGAKRKDQAKHQKAANILFNGRPAEIVDTKKRPQWQVVTGPKSIAARLGVKKTSKGWRNKELLDLLAKPHDLRD